jgi:hypothetical protein
LPNKIAPSAAKSVMNFREVIFYELR